MNKSFLKSTFVGIVLLALIAGAGLGLAQSISASGSGSAGAAGIATAVSATVAAGVPAGFSVIPADDSDRGDDQIVQLENLTIQSTSGSVPGTIYASHDIGGSKCHEYLDVDGRGGSKIYPCPLAPTVLYQISIESDTILLLKNRARARIIDFAAGDRINVFGFMDPGTSAVQALIVRNLDKPATPQYVQL